MYSKTYLCGMQQAPAEGIANDSAVQRAAVADSTWAGDSLHTASLVREVEPKVEDPAPEPVYPNFFYTTYSKDWVMEPRRDVPDSWILPLLLLGVYLAAAIRALFPKTLATMGRNLLRSGGLRLMAEDENIMYRRSISLLFLLFLIVSPVFAYQLSGYFGLRAVLLPYMPPYGQLFLIGAGLLGIKLITIYFLGYLFQCLTEARQYLLGILICAGLLGVLLIPVSLGFKLAPGEWSTAFVYAGMGLFGLIYALSLLIGASAGWRSAGLSKFHLFLYFCTLEIIPVFLVIKTVKNGL